MISSEKIKKILPIVSLFLGVIALIMVFLPAVSVSAMGATEKCNGLKSIFGFKEYDGTGNKIQIFSFSFAAMLPYVFAFIAGFLAYYGSKNNNNISKIFAMLLFLAATILFFCMIDLIIVAPEAFQTQLTDAELELAREIFKGFMSLAAGTILGAICCIFGIITIFVEMFYYNISNFFQQ